MSSSSPYRAVLLDLEGTIQESSHALPGAVEAVAAVRRAGIAVRYVTNTTRVGRSALRSRLLAIGFEVGETELFTAVTAAAEWCRAHGVGTVFPLLAAEALPDLEGLRVSSLADSVAGPPHPNSEHEPGNEEGGREAVIVGDLGEGWTYAVLNAAFRRLREGAILVACQKNRCWQTPAGLSLDAGPFVAALEYAASTEALVVGKPSAVFYGAALAGLGVPPREAVMLGDDAEVDAGGAIEAGLSGWLVRSGKYRPGDESRVTPWPECVLDSIADLPMALGIT